MKEIQEARDLLALIQADPSNSRNIWESSRLSRYYPCRDFIGKHTQQCAILACLFTEKEVDTFERILQHCRDLVITKDTQLMDSLAELADAYDQLKLNPNAETVIYNFNKAYECVYKAAGWEFIDASTEKAHCDAEDKIINDLVSSNFIDNDPIQNRPVHKKLMEDMRDFHRAHRAQRKSVN